MKKVLIEIPDEFENDLKDKFNDFFGRVRADLGDYSETLLCGNYEMETIDMFLKSFDSGKVLSGMTNGDVIKAMLNNSVYELEITEIETVYCEKIVKVIGRSKEKDPNIIGGKNKPLFNCTFKADWWNEPYKAEMEVEEWIKKN